MEDNSEQMEERLHEVEEKIEHARELADDVKPHIEGEPLMGEDAPSDERTDDAIAPG